MKKLVMCVLLVTGLGTAAMAQADKKEKGDFKKLTLEQRVEQRTERMAKSLQLTDAQKQAVYKLNMESAQAMKAENAKRKESIKAVRLEKEAKLRAILTPEQQQKHDQMKAERKKKMQERKASGKGWKHKGQNGTPQPAQVGEAKPVK